MPNIIVNNGTTLSVAAASGLPLTGDGTILPAGLLDGFGTASGAFNLINLGTIAADSSGHTLTINTGTLTNGGTVVASAGNLVVANAVAIQGLSSDGTLSTGVWAASGNGVLTFGAMPIVADNAVITLSGTNAAIVDAGGSQDLAASLALVGAGGQLNLLNNASFAEGNTLMVAGTVTLAGGGGTLGQFGNVTVVAGGLVSGAGYLDSASLFEDDGTIRAHGGTLTAPQSADLGGTGTLIVDAGASLALQALGQYSETIVNSGTIDAQFVGISANLTIGAGYSGTGSFLIQGDVSNSGTTGLELASGVTANVSFDTGVGELVLHGPTAYTGTISHFGSHNVIEVLGEIANTATLSGNILSLYNNGTFDQGLTIDTSSMNYSSASFHIAQQGTTGNSLLTVTGAQAAACYAAGTRIRMESGEEAAVEAIKAGDIVRAHFAGTAKVIWAGHRRVDCAAHPNPEKVWPVRIEAHAFGPRLPVRDLLLSPDHAVFADGALIPVKHLINGKTIRRETTDAVHYYHIELAEHDILFAEGLPAESYLENGDRAAFDNGGPAVTMHPEFGPRRWDAFGCAPLVVAGPRLAAVTGRLTARAEDIARARERARRAA